MSQFHVFAIDGFDLTGTDSNGNQWTVEAVQGWFTGGDVRASVEPRSQQDGDWRGTVYRGGRVVTLRGKVFAPTTAALEAASRSLSALLRAGAGELTGTSEAGAYSAMVRLDDLPLFDPVSDRAATWQISVGSESNLLYAPPTFGRTTLAAAAGGAGLVFPLSFPLDFGVAPGVTPGALTLPNDGTSSYHPRIRIDGGVTNPRITLAETGDVIALDYEIAEGQWVDINANKPREVLLNGAVSLRHLTTYTGNWCAVPVGGGSLSWTADAYTSTHSLSAWGYEGAYV